METDFINYHTRVESYYKDINSDQNLVIIWEKRLVDEYVWKISSQLKDILTCNIKLTFVTDFPYEGKNPKLDKFRKFTDLDLVKVNLKEKSLLDTAFQIAEEKKSKKIIYLQDSVLKTVDKKKLNHINERNKLKLKLSPKLTSLVSQVFSNLNESKIVERFHMINILRKRSFYKEMFTVDGAGDGNGVLIANNYDIKYAKLSELNDDILLFLFAFIKDNQKFIKARTIDYIIKNKDNFIIWIFDSVPVGMFETISLTENIVEIWAFIIDENLHWLGIWTTFLEKVLELKASKEYSDKRFIIVTFNPILKNILRSKCIDTLSEKNIIDVSLKSRYQKMLEDNIINKQDREMFFLD